MELYYVCIMKPTPYFESNGIMLGIDIILPSVELHLPVYKSKNI